ncbi:MAG: LysM peptidoglycan-binding domain-containing protein [Clostridia bacterium]|nr:LysM peptidoglycan-binding domain-containing protein [Clostridia bacterium]
MIKLQSTVSDGGIYYCEIGDTLDSIANRFSTSKQIIIKDNCLSGEIKEGDCLYIKRYSRVYTVKVGDTPESVAGVLGVTVEKLYEINGINYIYPFMQVVCE